MASEKFDLNKLKNTALSLPREVRTGFVKLGLKEAGVVVVEDGKTQELLEDYDKNDSGVTKPFRGKARSRNDVINKARNKRSRKGYRPSHHPPSGAFETDQRTEGVDF